MASAALIQQLLQWQIQAAQHHIRLPVIWQGEQDSLLDHTTELLSSSKYKTLYWIGDKAPADAVCLNQKHNYQVLGSECDILVINAFAGFPADLVAASAGCLKAGGIWLLLCPPFAKWQQQANLAHKSVIPYPLDASLHIGHFVTFWLSQLQHLNKVLLLDDQLIQPLTWPAQPTENDVPAPFVTAEQQIAVDAINHISSGHRRRPLVISADRGRGKSAVLGIAAAQLTAKGKHLLLTAPSPQAAQTALTHFQRLSNGEQANQLQFIPFDELLRGTYSADMLLIDEAAAIPTPVLQQLLQRFSRIVFASTEHGYEGTGRGFKLRFQQHLNDQCPGWKKLHLQQPIRYQIDDPLEHIVFQSFLLQQYDNEAEYNPALAVIFYTFSAADWLVNPEKLQQVFSLLSLAHYQTQVKDLAALLDNPKLQVMTIYQHKTLLACALVCEEGEIPAALGTQIYQAERRVQGHLLAQSLAFHLAKPELASKRLWRVMRIAVQPNLQRVGLGTQLLGYIQQQAATHSVEYLGTSFGATSALVQFWRNAAYSPVRLGNSIDKASAEYSVLMLQAVNGGTDVVLELAQQFSQHLYHNLKHYSQLDTQLAYELASAPKQFELSLSEQHQLLLFCQGKRPYELVSHLLLSWFNLNSDQLPEPLRLVLCALLWQQRDWSTLLQQFSAASKKSLLASIGLAMQQYDILSRNQGCSG